MRKRPFWQIGLLAAALIVGARITHGVNARNIAIRPAIPFPAYTGAGVILLCAAVVLAGRNVYRRALVGMGRKSAPLARASRGEYARRWFIFGLLVLAGVLIFLEIREPRYFLRDDSLITSQPAVVAGMNQIAQGHWPEWDAHQLMGVPRAGLGGFTYPPTYIAYGIARWGLRDTTDFSDVFCILHVVVGYALMFLTCRRLGISGALSTAGALALVLSGYSLIAGRSWSSVALAPVVFGPLLALSLIKLAQHKTSLRWIVCTGLSIGVFYQMGFTQIWFYGMICYVLAALVMALSGAITDRMLLQAVAATLLGVGLSLPLMVTQMAIAGDIQRQSSTGIGIERGLASLILPAPLARSHDPESFIGVHDELAGQIYYSGTLFAAVGLLAFGSMLVLRWNRASVRRNIWIIVAAATFLIALGRDGGLQLLLLKLPLINKNLGYPFRILPFFNLFVILGAAIIVQRALRRMRRASFERAVGLATIALVVYGAMLCKTAFYYYGFDGYPELPTGLRAALDAGGKGARLQRVIPAGPWFSMRPDWWQILPGQLATHYGYYSFDGYDPGVEDSQMRREITGRLRIDASYPDQYPEAAAAEPIHAYDRVRRDLQALGVRWVLLMQPDPRLVPQPPDLYVKYPGLGEATIGRWSIGNPRVWLPGIGAKRWEQGEISLYEIPDPRPMAFAEDAPDRALPVVLRHDGFDVDASSLSGQQRVVLNFTAWPLWQVKADGKPIKIEEDFTPVRFNRIIVTVPAGTRLITARYSPPYKPGLECGATVSAMAIVMGWLLKRTRRV